MSGIRTIVEGGRTYRIADGETFVYRVLAMGRVVDAITGDPLRGDFFLRTERAGVRVKIVPGGLFCAAGYSDRVFPTLGLAPDTLTLFLSAPGFLDRALTVDIPQNAVFPLDLGDVLIERPRVRLQGRVVDDANRQPLPDASVVVEMPGILGLRTPLRFDHAAGIGVAGQTLALGAARRLIFPVRAGDRAVVVNSLAAIAGGTTLQIGAPRQAELVIVRNVVASEVLLETPLTRSFPPDTPVHIVTLTPVLPGTTISRAARAGDGLLHTAAPLAAQFIGIADGNRTEQHAAGALTGADGFYSLGGIGGLRDIVLLAFAAGFPAAHQAPLTVTLDYAVPSNVADFVLSP